MSDILGNLTSGLAEKMYDVASSFYSFIFGICHDLIVQLGKTSFVQYMLVFGRESIASIMSENVFFFILGIIGLFIALNVLSKFISIFF